MLRGLAKLPFLSVAAYQRQGGIEGLEAAYVEDAVGAAARAAGLAANRVLALLLDLVDETEPDKPKAKSLAAAELAAKAGLDTARSDRILTLLDQKGVIRRVGEVADVSPVWSLYHDYLAWAVFAAHRRADRWQRLLQERRRALSEAGTWASHWRALLSPWEQLRLIGATLTRKVRWAGYRGFAALSGLRLLPLLTVLALTGIGADLALDWQTQQETHQILTAIRGGSSNDRPQGEEYRKLWALASARPRLRHTFLEQSIRDPDSHSALLKHLVPHFFRYCECLGDVRVKLRRLYLQYRGK